MLALFSRLTFIAVFVLSSAVPAPAEYIGRSPAELGKVEFATSCSSAVQDEFARGVALLHSFWWSEGEKTFKDVLARDPGCTMALWGLASIYMNNPFGTPPASRPTDARAAVDRARQNPAKTQRERDYLDAAAACYQDYASRPEAARQLARAKAYEALVSKYPNDEEAKIFYALYLTSSQPLADQTYASRKTAAAILEKLWITHPDHPGVAHYLIHCYDEPQMAQQGLPAANRYADIAPAAPHALHMPSHIFTRVGAWKQSVETNRRSALAATQSKDVGDFMHATDFAVYAELQMARDNDARGALPGAREVDTSKVSVAAAPYALAAIPARIAVERGSWHEAAQLEVVSSAYPFTEATTRFARALGLARSGDPTGAKQEVDRLTALRDALIAAKNPYWSNEVDIMRLSSVAWIALAENRLDEARTLMRQAADMEDKTEKAAITPGRILPARELLGDLLLELKRPVDALKEYETSQIREPNRFRSLYGAAAAAAQSGNSHMARLYYRKLVAMAQSGDPRVELIVARTYLANQKVSTR